MFYLLVYFFLWFPRFGKTSSSTSNGESLVNREITWQKRNNWTNVDWLWYGHVDTGVIQFDSIRDSSREMTYRLGVPKIFQQPEIHFKAINSWRCVGKGQITLAGINPKICSRRSHDANSSNETNNFQYQKKISKRLYQFWKSNRDEYA